MADSQRRGFTPTVVILALLATGVSAALALTCLSSPLDDETRSSTVAVQGSAGLAAALAWLCAVCGAALSVLTVAAALTSRRSSRQAQ